MALRVVAVQTDVRAQLARTLVLAGLDLLRFDRGATRLETVFIKLSRDQRRGRARPTVRACRRGRRRPS